MKSSTMSKMNKPPQQLAPQQLALWTDPDFTPPVPVETEPQPDLPQPKVYIMKQLRCNTDPELIIEQVMDLYSVDITEAQSLMKQANAKLDEQYTAYTAEVAKKNIQCLQQIVADAMDASKYSIALDAIDKLNKIAGLYADNKMSIKSDGPIQITFAQT